MNLQVFSDDLKDVVLNKAGLQARKYFQTFVGIPHIFLATFSFLVANGKEGQPYQQTFETLKSILNSYGINGRGFEKVFLESFPKGTEPENGEVLTAQVDREFKTLIETLKRKAIKEKRSMEIEDLIFEMFTERSFTIFQLFTEITGSDTKTNEMYDQILKSFKKKFIPEVKDLEEMPELTNLNKWVKEHPQVVINDEEQCKKIMMGLSGKSIRNVMLTGPAGCGKSTFVYGFVQRINEGNVPSAFQDKIIYAIDAGALQAGTRYRGDLEEKLVNILTVVKENPSVILFADEAHTLLTANGGDHDGGAQSVGNLLKPYITRGEIQLIGCTTGEEYQKSIANDKALSSRFHQVIIEEPTMEETEKILEGILPSESEYFRKTIQLELVKRVVELSEKYTLDQANPRKAINMLESACAYAKIFEEKKEEVDLNAVIESVKLKYNLFISDNKLESSEKALKAELYGQDEALDKILKDLEIVEAGVTDLRRPLYSVLLCGATGVGKTEACKILAKSYFGSENNLIKVNMAEYGSETDVTKLTGASAGYVGKIIIAPLLSN